jgi:hypothetical protein
VWWGEIILVIDIVHTMLLLEVGPQPVKRKQLLRPLLLLLSRFIDRHFAIWRVALYRAQAVISGRGFVGATRSFSGTSLLVVFCGTGFDKQWLHANNRSALALFAPRRLAHQHRGGPSRCAMLNQASLLLGQQADLHPIMAVAMPNHAQKTHDYGSIAGNCT